MGEILPACHAARWGDAEVVAAMTDISAAGFSGIELHPNIVPLFEDRVQVFREIMQETGLALAAIEARFGALGEATIDAEVERLASCSRFLAANDGGALVVRPPPRRKGSIEHMIQATELLGRQAADTGVRVCLHPEHGSAVETRGELESVLDRTSAKHVGLCLETGHLIAIRANPAAFYKKYRSRVWHAHFRDVKKPTKKRSPRPAAFGKGTVRFTTLFRTMEEKGYEGWVSFELPELRNSPPAEQARAALEFAEQELHMGE